jgi:hypothetical protein
VISCIHSVVKFEATDLDIETVGVQISNTSYSSNSRTDYQAEGGQNSDDLKHQAEDLYPNFFWLCIDLYL